MNAINASDRPAYLAIADAIADDIQSGHLTAQQRLPTLRQLAQELQLNFTTVARGYAEAQRRGLVDARPGYGTVVREIGGGAARRGAAGSLIDMTMNMPPEPRDPALLARIHDGYLSLRGQADPYALLRYQEFGGTPEEREAGAAWLNLPDVGGPRVLVCPGVQSALLALLMVLARAGETIACEAVTYPGIKGLAAQLGIRLVGLPIDAQGLDPDAFEALCAATPPKALYVNPTLLNPTTATLPLERREAIAAIARRYGVPIIEDDAYARLPSQPPPALATLAPELGFYVSGFSKCLGAGLRVGYLTTPNARYAARLSAVLRTTSVMASPMLTALATRWIHDGTAAAVAAAVREESRARQRLAVRTLTRAAFQTDADAFHLWLKTPAPWTRIEFATHLRGHGIGVVVSDTFSVGGPAPEAVRVCLGGAASREECGHMLEMIEDAIEQLPALASRVM